MTANVLSVDPGEVHNGLAVWSLRDPATDSGPATWECLQADRVGVEQLFDEVIAVLRDGSTTALVVEEYRLYPWLLHQQGFSSVGTVEQIGVLRFLAKRYGVTYVLQGASIKKLATARMRTVGYEFLGKNQHARDAEMHGWWHLFHDTF